jgi:hypothetical protein
MGRFHRTQGLKAWSLFETYGKFNMTMSTLTSPERDMQADLLIGRLPLHVLQPTPCSATVPPWDLEYFIITKTTL